jgi:hypothetical protein
MSPLKAAAILIVSGFCACAVARAEDKEVLILGIGAQSCAYWQSTPARQAEGKVWVYGFWSAANVYNNHNHTVGRKTDAYGDVAQVKKTCENEPSMSLADAATQTYFEMDK